MSERIQRLVMQAFRGVPDVMTVDFGKGDSIAVYGDNGTGKSTIADALEWYFTGEIEFLSHEGRQHAVRHVAGDAGGMLSERDLALASTALRPGSVGIVVVTEDRWAEPLSLAAQHAGGQIIAGERIPARRVESVLAERTDDQ